MIVTMRAFLACAALGAALAPAPAAAGCPIPGYTAQKSGEGIVVWYDKYIVPFRTYAGTAENPPPTKEQVEARVEALEEINGRMLGDSLQFEPFVQQIIAHYARADDFKGLDNAMAQKIYRPGPALDFTAMCIETLSGRARDDSFAITFYGVTVGLCDRSGLRGLVFSEALINGAVEGRCRPNDFYLKRYVVPVDAGTNTVTFICRKDAHGCARQ